MLAPPEHCFPSLGFSSLRYNGDLEFTCSSQMRSVIRSQQTQTIIAAALVALITLGFLIGAPLYRV